MLSIPEPVFDGHLIFAPSFVLAEQLEAQGELLEGKALGTARRQDLQLMQDVAAARYVDSEALAKARKIGATVGKRRLKTVTERTRDFFLEAISDYRDGKISKTRFKNRLGEGMKSAWREAFIAGLRAGGVTGQSKGAPIVLEGNDEKWLKSAIQHEMRFLNRFANQIIDETTRMPIPRRVEMYLDALTSFYESARVIALPAMSVVHWSGPVDKRKCKSCEYLMANNPYTKDILPTTPRSGLTLCLTNCRDKLIIRRAGVDEMTSVVEGQRYTRNGHIRNLRKIKREG